MPRNLNLCFIKLKYPTLTPTDPPLPQNNHNRLLIKNFNSLYDVNTVATSDSESDTITTAITATPDFATAFASKRFFFASPGRSNSIIDSSSSLASTSSSMLSNENDNVVDIGSIAVPTYSPDPFVDFRRSMQEMVEARELHDVQENWDYLHELLMCYLSLNPKSTHKYIMGAFADLLVSLTTTPPPDNCHHHRK